MPEPQSPVWSTQLVVKVTREKPLQLTGAPTRPADCCCRRRPPPPPLHETGSTIRSTSELVTLEVAGWLQLTP